MVTKMSIKTYSELITIPTFEERFNYLKLNGVVGSDTFGHDRFLNQALYNSYEWRKLRNQIIVRDNGCDLAFPGYELSNRIIIHHLNPIRIEDIAERKSMVFDPENLVCVSHVTHNGIHYGDSNLLIKPSAERTKNDTCPWRH